jgi:hypothetical protein
MRNRGIVVSLLAAGLVPPLVGVPPATAVPVQTGQGTIFDTRVPGMPTTAEGWRTLRSVTGETTWSTGEVALNATLAEPVPDGGSVSVTWAFGHWSGPGECAPEQVVTETPAVAAGLTVVSATRTVAGLAHDYSCLDVSLTSGGAVTDRMRDGWVDRIALSGAEADLATPSGTGRRTTVLAGRSTKVLVLVRSHVLPSSRVEVTGTGPVALRPFTVTGLAADEVRPVVARVKAPAKGRSRLALQARDERGVDDYDGTSGVRAVVARGRLLAGAYRSVDGAVRLRVDDRHRVRGLRATTSPCPSGRSGVLRLGPVRLPRSGATAVAVKDRGGYVAAQLLTLTPRRLTGVVVRTSPGCTQVVPFTVRRR